SLPPRLTLSLSNGSPVRVWRPTSPPPPHADLLARRLAKDDSLLVTYWDRLGWKDTLAREDNTRLQRAYAEKSDAGVGVCTPQIAANGGGGAVGSWENDIRWLVRGATGQAP
ncbi:DUF1223 domain-containing protein, partial [Parasphingorhabdus sp.]|uniref:DUF1223 domain-containing protein n=1 Tax=Parasphingorhabdus sp. TaxID=2709688 RepID=UPI00309D7A1B